MSKRVRIPQENKIRAILQKEINSICPFCSNEDIGHFQIHHINDNPGDNDIKNLILLCPTCHSKITKKDILMEDVLRIKLNPISKGQTKRQAQIFHINSNLAPSVFGNNNKVIIKNTKASKKVKYPVGCIGSENIKANYIGYLITRYHECKESEVGKSNMNYAIFASHLKKKFKMGKSRTIYNVPINRFDELADYILHRISKTRLGIILKSKNQKIVSSFDEYLSEQGVNYT